MDITSTQTPWPELHTDGGGLDGLIRRAATRFRFGMPEIEARASLAVDGRSLGEQEFFHVWTAARLLSETP